MTLREQAIQAMKSGAVFGPKGSDAMVCALDGLLQWLRDTDAVHDFNEMKACEIGNLCDLLGGGETE